MTPSMLLADQTSRPPCNACGRCPTAKGHDACIADLPGVRFACCGHGGLPDEYGDVGRGYLVLVDGRCIYFDHMSGLEIRALVVMAQAGLPLPENIYVSPELSWCAGLTDEQFEWAWAQFQSGDRHLGKVVKAAKRLFPDKAATLDDECVREAL